MPGEAPVYWRAFSASASGSAQRGCATCALEPHTAHSRPTLRPGLQPAEVLLDEREQIAGGCVRVGCTVGGCVAKHQAGQRRPSRLVSLHVTFVDILLGQDRLRRVDVVGEQVSCQHCVTVVL